MRSCQGELGNIALCDLPDTVVLVPVAMLASAGDVNDHRLLPEMSVAVQVGGSDDRDLNHVEAVMIESSSART